MIAITHSQTRGPDGADHRCELTFDARFLEVLPELKDAKLAIFIALALNTDEDGDIEVDVEALAEATGYSVPTIIKHVEEMCGMTINDRPVLARWRERNEKGQFEGSNRYRLFPVERDGEEPDLTFSTCGESLEHIIKDSKDSEDSREPGRDSSDTNSVESSRDGDSVSKKVSEPKKRGENFPKMAETDHQKTMRLFDEALKETNPRNGVKDGGASGKAVKAMLERGYTPEQITAVWRKLKSEDFWTGKYLSMAVVNKQIDDVLAKKGSVTDGGTNGNRRRGISPELAEQIRAGHREANARRRAEQGGVPGVSGGAPARDGGADPKRSKQTPETLRRRQP